MKAGFLGGGLWKLEYSMFGLCCNSYQWSISWSFVIFKICKGGELHKKGFLVGVVYES